MDCNKDEAIRVKELAEKKLAEKDIAGANKFALKSQNLYPGLDGLAQLLATLDVYISAEKRIDGEVDWYGVLGVEPLADDHTIRKQYRKLALSLHPDKNKLVGAEGAFKVVSEAWSLLSDKAKRISYDQRRNLSELLQNVRASSSMPAGQNGFHSFTNNINLNTKDQRNANPHQPFPSPRPPSKPGTFWTTCNVCKMQFEYLRTHLNKNLVCHHCHEHFLAIETPSPSINGNDSSTLRSSHMQKKNSSQHATTGNSYAPGRPPSRLSGVNLSNAFSKSGSAENMPAQASSIFQDADVVQPAFEQSKRRYEEVPTDVMREDVFLMKTHAPKKTGAGLSTGSTNAGCSSVKGDRPKKKRRIDEHRMNNNERVMANQVTTGVGVYRSQKGRFQTGKVNVMSQLEIRNLLMNKAQQEIQQKINGSNVAAVSETSDKEIRKKKEDESSDVNGVKTDENKTTECVDKKPSIEIKESSFTNSDVDHGIKEADLLTMSVPDPDFHDFDNDRTEKSFGENQVWAAYDDDDGMPRYYAMIHSVVSLKPFTMRISWLRSKSNNELAPINWISCGFYKTSGDFRIGKHEVNKSLNSFSHRVKWTKGTKGVIQIYPKEGDVWALYRNWSPDWNELTPDEVIQKYDMVEVLADYDEMRGVIVAPLVKIAGFKTVFRRRPEPSKTRAVPREEMFRFSHQVSSYLLTGQEGHNAPKGCLELDPAAMPLELLQVLTEAQLREMEGATEKAKEDIAVGDVKKSEEDELVENRKSTKEKGIAKETEKKVAADVTMKGKEIKEEKMIVYQRRRLGKQKI